MRVNDPLTAHDNQQLKFDNSSHESSTFGVNSFTLVNISQGRRKDYRNLTVTHLKNTILVEQGLLILLSAACLWHLLKKDSLRLSSTALIVKFY